MWHVVPIDDTHGHEDSTTCKCEPRIMMDTPEMICVHNSFDGREAIEEAKKILGVSDDKPTYKFDPKWKGDWVE